MIFKSIDNLASQSGKNVHEIPQYKNQRTVNCSSQETEVTSTPTKPVDNVVIATQGLQDRNTNITAGTTVENKGKLTLCDSEASSRLVDLGPQGTVKCRL